ncbi:extracellular calcium-sensing receptor-like [Acipenser ruthenus]|uniref:extracellular calcium-sensing receptor-like n=1 Tax=Acipenser ruthenus TaxID=7906 RepID=UPI002740954B|nr:extracellular calcium-sensing receptor-like [Acipenser ruthenus]
MYRRGVTFLAAFLLQLCRPVCSAVQPGCRLGSLRREGVVVEGDVIIGGTFGVHENKMFPEINYTQQPQRAQCQSFSFRNYRWLHAMIFAIKQINENPELLPNISLGYGLYDSCDVIPRGLEGAMWLVSGQDELVPNYRCHDTAPLAAIVGDSASSVSIPMARLLGLYGYPQISYFATAPTLSNKREFPSFFRTIPSDAVQGKGLARLASRLRWTWVGVLTDDDDYGQGIAREFQQEALRLGICVEFLELVPILYSHSRTQRLVEVIKASTAKAIAVFSWKTYLYPIMEEIHRQNVTGKTWLASEAWSTAQALSDNRAFEMLTGTIGFTIHRGTLPGFKDYLLSVHPFRNPQDIFLRLFWEQAFGCSWQGDGAGVRLCTGSEDLAGLKNIFLDVSSLRLTYNTYNAVYAVAQALHDLQACSPGEGPFDGGACADVKDFEPWQILHYLRKVRFKNPEGEEVYFDENGDPPALYDIVNWQPTPAGDIQYVKVGSYDFRAPPGQELFLDESAIVWPGGEMQVPRSVCSESCLPGWRTALRRGQPVCCFDCIPCSVGEISNQTDSTKCLRCPSDQWSNTRQDACVPRLVEFLSYEEPLGASLASLAVLASLLPASILGVFLRHRHSPIVKANNRQLSYVLLGALALCPLCSLIFIGRPSPASCMLRQTAFAIVFTLGVSCVLAKTLMVVIAFKASIPGSGLRRWVGSRLPNTVASVGTLVQVGICGAWLGLASPYPENNTTSHVARIVLECNEGSALAFWCMLGYMGVLASVSFVVAFLARRLPDSFNEAKFITFSMLVFVSVWLSFIPAYMSTGGKYMVAVEIFAILSSSMGLLACIFFPKCYVILLRPERNTRDHLMGKGAAAARKN